MTGRSSAAIVMAAVVVAVSGATTGCSGEDSASGAADPAAAIRDAQDAFAAGDAAATCDRIAKDAGTIEHGTPTSCERAVRHLFGAMPRGRWSKGERPHVARVDAEGGRATAIVEDQAGRAAKVRLAKVDGSWRQAALIGMPLREFDEFEDHLRAFDLPASRSKPINVVDGSGAPCPPLRNGNYPRVKGGCVVEVSGRNVPIRLLTAFGEFELAKCTVGYRIAVSPSGRTWTSKVTFQDFLLEACSKLEPCLTNAWAFKPWAGQLESDGDGSYTHRMLICLRTGVGLLGGELVMRLTRDGDGWKVKPSGEGDTGLQIDRALAVEGAPFDIRR